MRDCQRKYLKPLLLNKGELELQLCIQATGGFLTDFYQQIIEASLEFIGRDPGAGNICPPVLATISFANYVKSS